MTGPLVLATDARRSRSEQARAGGSDRLPTDDGGHYIAVRFNGPTDSFNHFAQDANFNRGSYRALETTWAREVVRGRRVYVAITPIYGGLSKRPSEIRVSYSIDGSPGSREFSNSSGKATRAK